MERRALIAIAAAVLLATVVACASAGESDATDVVQEQTVYCYGDNPVVRPMYSGSSTWNVEGASYEENGDGSITVHLAGATEKVIVTQTVGDEQSVTTLIPLHIAADEKDDDKVYTIRFLDMGEVVRTYTIDGYTTVVEGDPFVIPPADLSRDGYIFGGWYTDRSCDDEYLLDTHDVITSDIDVHAKWSATGSAGGNHTVTVSDTHVVTFQAINGLRYDVTSLNGSALSFTVSAVDGFRFDPDSVRVVSTAGSISLSNGVYTLSGIDEDIVVSITGDRVFSITYDCNGVGVTMPGSDTLPETTLSGPITFEVSSPTGWGGPDIRVLMGGVDITDECLDGGRISIEDVTGDLLIIADPGFPWIYVIVVVVIIAVALVAIYYYYRNKSDRTENNE